MSAEDSVVELLSSSRVRADLILILEGPPSGDNALITLVNIHCKLSQIVQVARKRIVDALITRNSAIVEAVA